MTDDVSQSDIEIASKAQRVAREWPETKEAIRFLLNDKTKKWIASNDRDERERLHAEVRALDDLLNDLNTTMMMGAAAKARLEGAD